MVASDLTEFGRLLLGTVIYRPYVYMFFACFLAFALRELGARRTLFWIFTTYLIAWASEYSATRNGFPFGIYTYIDTTRTRELWLSNVPFWDSLSFVFLAYFSRVVATGAIGRSRWTPVLGGFLMMCLDLVIDPVTLLGDRWFLGKIYFYPNGGPYFGVTIQNFLGWWFVGWASQAFFEWSCARLPWLAPDGSGMDSRFARLAFGVYAGVFAFNLAVTLFVAEAPLIAASSAVTLATLTPLALRLFWREPCSC